MKLKFLRRWLNAVVDFFSEKQGDQNAIVMIPLARPTDIQEAHEEALRLDRLFDKQKAAFEKVKSMGKSCLDNYVPPENHDSNRIGVWFRRNRIQTPAEEKRQPCRPVEIRTGHDRRTHHL